VTPAHALSIMQMDMPRDREILIFTV